MIECPKCNQSMSYIGKKIAKCSLCETVYFLNEKRILSVNPDSLDAEKKELLKKHNDAEKLIKIEQPENERKPNNRDRVLKIVLFLGLLLAIVSLFLGFSSLNGICLLLFIVGLFVSLFCFICAYTSFGDWLFDDSDSDQSQASSDVEDAKNQLKYENERRMYLEAFYHRCNRYFTLLEGDKSIERARLIMSDYECFKNSDVFEVYDEAKTFYEVTHEDDIANANKNLLENEKQILEKVDRYLQYFGREKRVKMLSDIVDEYDNSIKSIRGGISNVKNNINLLTQRESDWAVIGGIANGIAGPAAGVVTALNVQAKNEQIRANNQEIYKTVAKASISADERIRRLEDEKSVYYKQLIDAKLKLVSEDSSDECIKYLSFNSTKIEVSETGTCTIKTNVIANKDLIIFDDVEATIDGSINANIFLGEKRIGTATMVLPLEGVDNFNSRWLIGMCLSCGKQEDAEKYTVVFTANKLWLIEK